MITSVQWQSTTASLSGTGAILRQIVIPAGTIAARHHHDKEQFLFVASGGGTLQCEAGAIVLAPGVALHLPAGDWHSAAFDVGTVLIELNLT